MDLKEKLDKVLFPTLSDVIEECLEKLTIITEAEETYDPDEEMVAQSQKERAERSQKLPEDKDAQSKERINSVSKFLLEWLPALTKHFPKLAEGWFGRGQSQKLEQRIKQHIKAGKAQQVYNALAKWKNDVFKPSITKRRQYLKDEFEMSQKLWDGLKKLFP